MSGRLERFAHRVIKWSGVAGPSSSPELGHRLGSHRADLWLLGLLAARYKYRDHDRHPF
jgi:hypothetical protein